MTHSPPLCWTVLLVALAGWGCACRCAAGSLPESHASKDLLPSARAVMRGYMIKSVAPLPQHPDMIRANYYSKALPKPLLIDDQWDWGDCGARAVQAWLYMREMTGDKSIGKEIEQGEVRSLFHVLAPDDGMACVPERSRPDEGSYYYEMWDQGRTLRALVHLWKTETDKAGKQAIRGRIDKMIRGLSRTATRGTDPCLGAYAIFPPSVGPNRPTNTIPCPGAAQLIEPLAQYWAATGDGSVRVFLDELVAGALSGREGGDSVFNPDGSFHGHFHGHVSGALGVGRYGKALFVRGEKSRGMELLKWSKRIYDWTISPNNPHRGSSWGWFPENVGYDALNVKEYAEICCVADMVEYAAFLAACADLDPALREWDALWDHVERYTLNSILPTQFAINAHYRAALAAVAGRSISSGYVTFEQDDTGCFNHETAGHQTLETKSGARLSQVVYGVAYDGKTASFRYRTGGQVLNEGFVTERAASGAKPGRSVVTTADGALKVETGAVCGSGPYVLRTTTVTNVGKELVRDVRLSCTVNPDTRNYADDTADARDDGSVVLRSSTGDAWFGMAAQPKADYTAIGDAVELLSDDRFGWDAAKKSFRGNAVARLVWRLGDLAAGEARAVTVTLSAASAEDEITRSLNHEEFPARPAPPDGLKADLAVAERMAGGWVALFMPGELFCMNSAVGMEIYTAGCCSYSGPRALYACWKPTLADDGVTASLRMPICRDSSVLTQTVNEESGAVRQSIAMHVPRVLRVRIPDWADMSGVRVTDSKGSECPCTVDGRWLDLGEQRADAQITLMYPLVVRKSTEAVGGAGKSMGFSPVSEQRTYTVTYSGNRVVAIKPGSEVLPIFPIARE